MVGWHHQLDGHEFEKALGDGEGRKRHVLQSTGSQRVGHDLATEQQQQQLQACLHVYIASKSGGLCQEGWSQALSLCS